MKSLLDPFNSNVVNCDAILVKVGKEIQWLEYGDGMNTYLRGGGP